VVKVVDTNVIAYLYLPGEHTPAVEGLLTADADWASPILWRSEFRNILAGCLLRGSLTFEQACGIQREAEGLLTGAEYDVDSRSVLELARSSGCSAYDCEFVALAIDLRTRLITMDREILRAFPGIAMDLGGALGG
jgi:predicted nucleic acid-binding protein